DVAVAVVVGRDDAEAVALRRVDEAVLGALFAERPVALVLEEEIRLAREARGAEHDLGPAAPRQRALRLLHVVPRRADVTRDVQVEVAVAVGVEERAARAPTASLD